MQKVITHVGLDVHAERIVIATEAHEDFPWGHRAIKVGRKAFVFMSKDEPGLSLSVKLPASAEGALQFPFCEPTHYGLGRSGWVTATFGPRDTVPLDVLQSWIDESYRAIAPKTLVARLVGGTPRARAHLSGADPKDHARKVVRRGARASPRRAGTGRHE
jgi:predicted DNA-binding protein (MmcQ/YjbR family)